MHGILRNLRSALRERPDTAEGGLRGRGSANKRDRFRLADVSWLVPFVRPHWRLGAVAAALALFSTAAALVLPLTFKALTDAALIGGDHAQLSRVILTVIGVLLVIATADFIKHVCFVRFQQQVILGVQGHLFHRLLRLPKAFFDSNRTGYLMSRVIGDVFELQAFLSLNLVNILTRSLQFAGAFGFLLFLNWRLTMVSLIVLPLFIAITRVFGIRLRHLNRTALEKSALVSQDLEETLSATALIKAFAAEDRETERITQRLRQAFDASFRRTTVSALFGLLSGVVNAIGMGGVLWYGASQVISQQLTIGELLAFSVYLGLLLQPAQFFAGLNVTLQHAFAAIDRVLELLDLMPEDDDETKIRVGKIEGKVTFEHVAFSYDAEHPALDDVSFAAGPRQLVAIVGRSGAGKSTLVNLIIALYRPDSGRISFDDGPSELLNRQSLRERIGIVSQEIFLFDDTIRNNIRYGRPEASDAEVLSAAIPAAAHEFISSLADGYETRVGEKGVTLSVGQKQRISIARAILKDPDILIFDEATSALDPLTERTVQTLLKDLSRRKTVFVIAHRLSTALLSDAILVLQKGRIVQQGTHEDLWREDGLYRELCRTELGHSRPGDEQESAATFDLGTDATSAGNRGARIQMPA
jgi:ATP-binding cassette, subfamily B, bacterial MsbA